MNMNRQDNLMGDSRLQSARRLRSGRSALAAGLALAAAALAPLAAAQNPQDYSSDALLPYPLLAERAANDLDEANRVWSQANARQAVTYMVGYGFGYEQIRAFGCGGPGRDVPVYGRFLHMEVLTDSQNSREFNIITPNNDTLYSLAALALDAEPVVFTAPASLNENNRYWSNMLQDAASNIPHVLGSGSTGTGDFVIAWKDWGGPLPTNLPVFLMDTPFIWPVIRTGVSGPDDIPNVIEIQQGYAYTPLSQYCEGRRGKNMCKFPRGGKPEIKPSRGQEVCDRFPENFNASPRGITENPLAFWDGVNAFTNLNPPPAYETGMLQAYKDIFVGPDQPQDLEDNSDAYDPIVIEVLEAAPGRMALALPEFIIGPVSETKNGWSAIRGLGNYGNTETGEPYDYLLRGAINMYGPGGLPSSEAVYYNAFTDVDGVPLSGSNVYQQVFVSPPPVGAFWSLTLYENDGFLYDNGGDGNIDNDVYSLGSTSVVPESDGSIILTISHSPSGAPPAGVTNWLPAPDAGFYLVLRTYQPLEPLTYFPPPLVQE